MSHHEEARGEDTPKTGRQDRAAAAEDSPGYPAEQARQGRIVLDTPTRRRIFFGGLIAFVVLVLILSLMT